MSEEQEAAEYTDEELERICDSTFREGVEQLEKLVAAGIRMRDVLIAAIPVMQVVAANLDVAAESTEDKDIHAYTGEAVDGLMDAQAVCTGVLTMMDGGAIDASDAEMVEMLKEAIKDDASS